MLAYHRVNLHLVLVCHHVDLRLVLPRQRLNLESGLLGDFVYLCGMLLSCAAPLLLGLCKVPCRICQLS